MVSSLMFVDSKFICPLTKKIFNQPGVDPFGDVYETTAINEYYQ